MDELSNSGDMSFILVNLIQHTYQLEHMNVPAYTIQCVMNVHSLFEFEFDIAMMHALTWDITYTLTHT